MHFRLTAAQTILPLTSAGNRKSARVEPEESMPTEEKPSRNEDEYFARMDADLMKERRARLDLEREQRERTSHYNKCPKCGVDLAEREHGGVKIDQCPECGGMWLDKGELEIIEELDRKSSSFIGGLFGLIR